MSSRVFDPKGRYSSCNRCGLADTRRHIVLGGTGRCSRGTVERDNRLLYFQGEIQTGDEPPILSPQPTAPLLLFLGEAPGRTEDLTGQPFTGKAGRIFSLCLSFTTSTFNFHVTNTIACRPWKVGKRGGIANREPLRTEIESCLPRVKDLLLTHSYSGIVHLGKVAKDALPQKNSLTLKHPSAILRQEYKFFDIREFAFLLDRYVSNLRQTKLDNKSGRNPS